MVCYNQLICQHPMQTIGCAHNLQHCIVAFPIASFILASRYVVAQAFPCAFWIGFPSKCLVGTATACHTPGTTSHVSEQPHVFANITWCRTWGRFMRMQRKSIAMLYAKKIHRHVVRYGRSIRIPDMRQYACSAGWDLRIVLH